MAQAQAHAQVGMAKGHLFSGYQPSPSAPPTAASDLSDIREYQKIIQFRDTVVSGKHPRIKVPPSAGKPSPSSQLPASNRPERVAQSPMQSQRSDKPVNGYQMGNMHSFKANSQQPAVVVAPTGPAAGIHGVPRNVTGGKTEFNPILLQKSDDLIKAEFSLQRQRLEKAIKDEGDQRKAASRTALSHSEQLPDLNLSDILAKALTLVQATAPPPVTTTSAAAAAADAPMAANASDASDSFDERTFYSSQHDTPESHASPRARAAPEDVQMQNTSPLQRQPNTDSYVPPPPTQFAAQSQSVPTTAPQQTNTGRNASNAYTSQNPSTLSQYPPAGLGMASQNRSASIATNAGAGAGGLLGQTQQGDAEVQVISSDSGPASRSDNSGNTDLEQPADHGHTQNSQRLLPNNNFRQRESPPVVRAHDLSLFAPRPARVSPLATARQPPMLEPGANIIQGAPAQVTALRQEHGVITSPESSPQGEKGGKKKNKKKNKKARAQDVPGSPDIKPEPRSPSPLSAPMFIRPQKRQRASGREEAELVVYDEPRLERPISQLQHDRYSEAPMPAERVPLTYERLDDPYARQVRHSVAPVRERLEPQLYEERRPDGTIVQYIRRVQSPAGYSVPYGAGEPRPMRSASYAVTNPSLREMATYPREGRMSVRPYADRARSQSPVMAPPSAPPPSRIVVDEYGREYLEPVRASTVARRSVMPSARPGDHEVIYERAPIRATSRMPGSESFEGDGVLYRRAASPSFAPRRIITQPEYSTDYRSYRERDYSTQPMGPPDQGLVQIRGGAERRISEQMPREYLSRATSVRPVDAAQYYERPQSTRPEVPYRQYAPSVHTEGRREVVPHVLREFSVRPAESEMPRREYSVRPAERYYDRPPPRDEEVKYIDRPRTVQQEIVYADDGRRQVYQ
ncbi:Uu.00g019150.m01.CDS01 [Anthostomella pinea]|uniref:Uu.00g019150.m01.CDS01 n=1 Tax=Anthostomella pinea TaxID=933095 RepID=A0AAI8VTE3_9PEZI|nr:Uu.00g019150.m01.CDS01 [Anthostomella pinea]